MGVGRGLECTCLGVSNFGIDIGKQEDLSQDFCLRLYLCRDDKRTVLIFSISKSPRPQSTKKRRTSVLLGESFAELWWGN